MKKAIAILIAVVMLLSCLGVAAVNAAVATVPGSVTLENSDIVYTADKGDTITYRVYITTPEIAENGQFYITYPESLIKVNSHSIPNTPGYMINYTSNLTDEIRFNFSNTNGCDLTSEKLLIELKFDVVGEGHGSIAFYSQVVSNLNDQSILKQTKFRETIEDADVFIPTELPTEPDTTDETNITEPTSDSSQPTTESDPDNTTDTTETDDTTTPTNTDETAEPTTESNESTTTGQDEPTTTESEEPGITQTPETTGPDKPTTTEPVTEPQEITEPSTPAPTTPAPKPTNPPSSKPNATQPVKPAKNLGKGTSGEAAQAAILAMKNDSDPKGSTFNLLQVKNTKTTNKSIKLSYKKPGGVKTFVIYGAKCGSDYKVLKTTTAKSININSLKKNTYYKFLVVALDKNGKVVATSKTIHVATNGGKNGNPSKVKITNASSAQKLAKGKSITLKTKVTAPKSVKVKNHRKVNFESSNTKILKVTNKGKVTAKKKGTATIYAYAQNGVATKIKIKVS